MDLICTLGLSPRFEKYCVRARDSMDIATALALLPYLTPRGCMLSAIMTWPSGPTGRIPTPSPRPTAIDPLTFDSRKLIARSLDDPPGRTVAPDLDALILRDQNVCQSAIDRFGAVRVHGNRVGRGIDLLDDVLPPLGGSGRGELDGRGTCTRVYRNSPIEKIQKSVCRNWTDDVGVVDEV